MASRQYEALIEIEQQEDGVGHFTCGNDLQLFIKKEIKELVCCLAWNCV